MVLEKITHKAYSTEGLCTQGVMASSPICWSVPDFSKVPRTTNEACNLVNCSVIIIPYQHTRNCDTQVPSTTLACSFLLTSLVNTYGGNTMHLANLQMRESSLMMDDFSVSPSV